VQSYPRLPISALLEAKDWGLCASRIAKHLIALVLAVAQPNKHSEYSLHTRTSAIMCTLQSDLRGSSFEKGSERVAHNNRIGF
jgi:hypothetical protein